MYARKENIPEENLDWDKTLQKEEHPETETEVKEEKHVIHPTSEHIKMKFEKKVKLSDLNIMQKINNLLDQHGEVTLLFALLTFPYIIGFIVVSFILIYGGVPINRFFSMKEGVFHFELWSIGAYIFITVGVIWLVMQLLLQRR